MKKAAFYTLGCKVNQYETEALAELFEKDGYEIVDFTESPADVYVINTCCVTSLSERKSRQIIRRAKSKNKESIVVVAGCYSQTLPEDIATLGEVDIIVGTKNREKIVEYVKTFEKNNTRVIYVDDVMKTKEYEKLNVGGYKSRTRANIKIQEGCGQFCSYCIIPYARGASRSREMEDVLGEVKRVANLGYKEVVLTGIHIASYGLDLNNASLIELIRSINDEKNIERIRLGSIEPNIITENFVNSIKNFEKLCPHFHISLQSGCDETLKRMNRKYTTEKYKQAVNSIREKIKDVAISTDIIVGFPGETDDEFKKTVDFLKEISFSKMHVFKYSKRKGTPAAKFDNQVSPKKKEERSCILIELSKQKTFEFNEEYIGRRLPVLFEDRYPEKEGYMQGFSSNYIKVVSKGDPQMKGNVYFVEFERNLEDYIEGVVIKN